MDKNKLIHEKEIFRYLGYKGNVPDEHMLYEIRECEEKFLKVVQPRFYYQVFDLRMIEDRLYTGDGEFEFLGKSILKHLAGCEKVAFSCATLSEDVDVLIDQAQENGEMLHALILDAIANAAIEEVRFAAEEALAQEYKEYKINWQFGIGYGDLPLSLQANFIDKINASKEIGIRASEHYLLHPLKSVTGFIGLKREDTAENLSRSHNCSACDHNTSCEYKKES